MPLGPQTSAVYLQQPVSSVLSGATRAPSSVTVHPAALFAILDHFLRRKESQERVIGTLLGVRTENEIAIKSAFAVLHSETVEQVAVDMDYHRTLYELHQKVNPKEVIVGWYSTGSNLNTYSALIHNFYSQETAPYPAVHIAIDTGVQEGEQVGVRAYLSSPVGVSPKPENAVFIPIPCELRFHEAERSGLELLTKAAASPVGLESDLANMEATLLQVSDMVERVLGYVRSVIAGEVEGDVSVGRYLMDSLNVSTAGIEKGKLEEIFNSHLQDTLMVSYLSNLVRAQVEVSSRLALMYIAGGYKITLQQLEEWCKVRGIKGAPGSYSVIVNNYFNEIKSRLTLLPCDYENEPIYLLRTHHDNDITATPFRYDLYQETDEAREMKNEMGIPDIEFITVPDPFYRWKSY